MIHKIILNVCILLVFACSQKPESTAPANRIAWFEGDFEEAFALAAQQNIYMTP